MKKQFKIVCVKHKYLRTVAFSETDFDELDAMSTGEAFESCVNECMDRLGCTNREDVIISIKNSN